MCSLFVRGGRLVRVDTSKGAPIVAQLEDAEVYGLIARVADWFADAGGIPVGDEPEPGPVPRSARVPARGAAAFEQVPTRNLFYIVDATQSGNEILAAVQERIRALEPTIAVHQPRTLSNLLGEQLGAEAAALRILGALALMALLLTLVGIYGVVAHSVHRRAGEMGLRLALGADRAGLVRLVLGQSLKLAAIGLGLGIIVSLVLGRSLALFLSGVQPTDPSVGVPNG